MEQAAIMQAFKYHREQGREQVHGEELLKTARELPIRHGRLRRFGGLVLAISDHKRRPDTIPDSWILYPRLLEMQEQGLVESQQDGALQPRTSEDTPTDPPLWLYSLVEPETPPETQTPPPLFLSYMK